MGMTLTEKILARHSGRQSVAAGENVWIGVDILMTHDVCGPGTIGIFKQRFGKDARVWSPDRVVIIPDHYIFTANAQAHRNIAILRDFVREQGLRYYYDPEFVQAEGMPSPYADPEKTSYKGVCHIALPEEGHTRPGEVLLGTDSHTCTAGAFGEFATGIGNTDAAFVLGTGKTWVKIPPTMRFHFSGELPPYLMAKDMILAIIGDIGVDGATYKAMEFAGEGVMSLSIEERMTLCNMVIEAGGKNGVIAVDSVTEGYVRERIRRAGTRSDWEPVRNDPDARYCFEKSYDLSTLEPVVAKPHSPDNKATVREVAGTKLTRAYIGSCTGGKLTDFIAAARILKGEECRIPTFIVPATTEVDAELDKHRIDGKTLREIFRDAGAQIGAASCSACLGGPADTFARLNSGEEVCISSTNRNFPGRMGHKDAQVFLASPLTVAASAIRGRITDPREVLVAVG
ncbi:3-isopropylmalate dehydratase large subunit [Candidatus Poribacteria bacterium]|nr:3-isopropylmalate dehydratase large subunit [Candidatus Poribacteria bacterium]